MSFSPRRGKVKDFLVGQGNLEKVREKTGNLKINGYGSYQKIYLFCLGGKDVFSRICAF